MRLDHSAWLPLYALLCGTGCDSLWGQYVEDTKDNCVVNQQACLPSQRCNPDTLLCEDRARGGGQCNGEGFCWENPLPNGHRLRAVWGTSASHLWAVGDLGAAWLWDGKAWTVQDVAGFDKILYGVWGSSPNDVWVVGEGGAAFHFDGQRWTGVASQAEGQHLASVWCASAQRCFAVGTNGTIVEYDGSRWTKVASSTTQHLQGAWGRRDADVYAVGNGGTVLHRDAQKWSVVTTGLADTTSLSSVHGLPEDDGELWISGLATAWHKPKAGMFEKPYVLSGNQLHVWAATAGAWAVGDTPILRWNGTTWNAEPPKEPTGVLYGLFGLQGAEPSLWAVGDGGQVLHREMGRFTDSAKASMGTRAWLYGVYAASADEVWAVGRYNTILRWNGRAWSIVRDGGAVNEWVEAAFGSGPGRPVHFVGSGGQILRWDPTQQALVKTSVDGNELNDVSGASEEDLWAVGKNNTVLHTMNGGQSWQRVTDPVVAMPMGAYWYGVYAAAQQVWVVGSPGTGMPIIARYDVATGKWTNEDAPMGATILYAIDGNGSDDIWAGGGAQLIHRVAGKWRMENPRGFSIKDSGGLAVTKAGDVWATGDTLLLHYDGKMLNWTTVTSGTNNSLQAVATHDGQEIWTVGQAGTILHRRP